MNIKFDELLFELRHDRFYGFRAEASSSGGEESTASPEEGDTSSDETESEATAQKKTENDRVIADASLEEWIADTDIAASRAPIATALLVVTYRQLLHVEQVHQFWWTFHQKFFKADLHREMVYLWCCFLGLPTYQSGKPLEWRWRGYIDNWNIDFEFKDDELREFLRSQKLPLPVYFFHDEPENTGDLVIVDRAVATLRKAVEEDAAPKSLNDLIREQRDQRLQARIDELSTLLEHQGKTHEQLCEIVEGEPIGMGLSKGTIMRRTRSPWPKK